VRLILGTTAVVSTIGFNFHVLVPVLASETLEAGPELLGALAACFGCGALLGALLSAALGRASWKLLLAGAAGFGTTLLLLAPQEHAAPAALFLFATGVCFVVWTSNSQSLLQLAAPDHLRGRVLGLWLFAFAGLAPAGGLLAGWLADTGGTLLSFGVAGAVILLAAGGASLRLNRRRQPAPATPLP
jgi:MFS family permease